jgi:hypothetical protein
MPHIEEAEDISQSFDTYWNDEQQKAFSQMVQQETFLLKNATTHRGLFICGKRAPPR